MKTFCLANDLKDDPQLIMEYEQHHRSVWAENLEGIRASGILTMDIFRTGNRLFMIMTTDDNFSFEAKGKADASKSTGMGGPDGQIPATHSLGKARRKMGIDAPDFCNA